MSDTVGAVLAQIQEALTAAFPDRPLSPHPKAPNNAIRMPVRPGYQLGGEFDREPHWVIWVWGALHNQQPSAPVGKVSLDLAGKVDRVRRGVYAADGGFSPRRMIDRMRAQNDLILHRIDSAKRVAERDAADRAELRAQLDVAGARPSDLTAAKYYGPRFQFGEIPMSFGAYAQPGRTYCICRDFISPTGKALGLSFVVRVEAAALRDVLSAVYAAACAIDRNGVF